MPTNTEAQPEGGNYLKVEFQVFPDTKNPNRVHIVSNDARFTDEHGGKPGLRIATHTSMVSADFNPGNFNRVVRALRNAGKELYGQQEVPVTDRKLTSRLSHIMRNWQG